MNLRVGVHKDSNGLQSGLLGKMETTGGRQSPVLCLSDPEVEGVDSATSDLH